MLQDDPVARLKQTLSEAWTDLRTRGAQGLLQMLPFGKRKETSAWELLAKKTLAQVKAENEFLVHAAAFVAGATFLVGANLVTTFFHVGEGYPGRIWSVIPVGGWGLGVVLHGIDAFLTKRQRFEEEARVLRPQIEAAAPAAALFPAVPAGEADDLHVLRERLIRSAEEARTALHLHDGSAADMVSRGEVKALTIVAWLDDARRAVGDPEADRARRREVATQLARPGAAATRAPLVELLSDLDRREKLRRTLAAEVDERKERLGSFLLALEGARLARPEALPALTAPLSERVALLEAAQLPAAGAATPADERGRRLEEELRLARELQRSILPQEAPAIAGLDVAHVYRPCGEVGGDFYDFYGSAEGKLLLCLGDASGHGIDSSMISSMAKGALYLQVGSGRDLAGALSEINRMMCDTLGRRRLMTMTLLAVDAREGTVSWVNAGQVYPMLLRRGRVIELEQPGYPLGVRRDVTYTIRREALEPGDLLLMFTDGLVEALSPSGDVYGWERLCRCLEGRTDVAPHAAVELLANDLEAHLGQGSPQDDVTLLAVSYRP